MKKKLEAVFNALMQTGIDFQRHQQQHVNSTSQEASCSSSTSTSAGSQDPTTWAATLSRMDQSRLSSLPRSLLHGGDDANFLAEKAVSQSADKAGAADSGASIFDIEGNIPRVRLTDLVTPQVVQVDGEKTSVWVNGSRTSETIVVNPGVKRVIEFG